MFNKWISTIEELVKKGDEQILIKESNYPRLSHQEPYVFHPRHDEQVILIKLTLSQFLRMKLSP